MAGTKRSSDDVGGTALTTRSTKVAKKDPATSPKSKGGKKGVKANIATTAFIANALPITLNITNTPPPITDDKDESAMVPAASADPGFIGSVKCLPSQFSTGSYGWKGNKRVTVEVKNEAGEKEKVQVQVTINATVVGSKNAPGDVAHNEHAEQPHERDQETQKTEEEAEAEVQDAEPEKVAEEPKV